MARRERRGGPLWYLGLWVPGSGAGGEPAPSLLSRTVRAFRALGATVEKDAADATDVLLTSRTLPSSPPGGVGVRTVEVSQESLVEVCLSGASVDGPDPADAQRARRLAAALVDVVLAVRPALATLSVEHPPEALPYPGEDDWWGLFGAGWVDLDRCTDRQRTAFERLVAAGRARDLDGGVWWSTGARFAATAEGPAIGAVDEDLARDAWRAWMRGRGTQGWTVPPGSAP